jgi:Zn-dependent protease with chaperone function
LCLTCTSITAFAQASRGYTPIQFLDTIPPKIYAQMVARRDNDKAAIDADGKVASYIKTLYDQRFDYVVKTFNSDFMMSDDSITAIVRKVFSKIHDANSQLARSANAYTFRSASPNALSFGEGTICVMLGLLERIESEDVLAFVLCHELAHQHNNHTKDRIEQLAVLNYDRTLKKQIDAIKGSPYGKYAKLRALFTSLELDINKHSREREHEADSVGLTYFLRTAYNPSAALRCMQILQKADSSLYTKRLDLQKYFHFADFPFKSSWDNYQRPAMWEAYHSALQADSLRTHPNCVDRYQALQSQLHNRSLPDAIGGPFISLDRLSKLAAFEIVSTEYHMRNYGRSLFSALILCERFPQDSYGPAMVCKNLFQIYQSQKNHKLAEVLEQPRPQYADNYNHFLSFMNNLRIGELVQIAYNYAISQPEQFYNHEEFIHGLWMCSRVPSSKVDPEKVRASYEDLYPKGRYAHEMKNY